jgi:putative ABC transport system substrate-binding protein
MFGPQEEPDVIVTGTGQAMLAAKQATTTIPIVQAVGGDLEELGLVASLARPGGNITGQSLRDQELAGKRLELLKEAVPTIIHVAVLIYSRGIASQPYPSAFEAEARAPSGYDCNASMPTRRRPLTRRWRP